MPAGGRCGWRWWRRRGVAAALKRTALAWAAAHELREVYTWTQLGNEDMQALNTHLGFFTRTESLKMRASLPLAGLSLSACRRPGPFFFWGRALAAAARLVAAEADDEQQDKGADDGTDDAHGVKAVDVHLVVLDEVLDEPADERTDDAQDDGADDSDGVTARQKQAGDQSSD
jgi:hypothetical protein